MFMISSPQEVVSHYIQAYNAFDIERMLSYFSPDCTFEDVSNTRGITRCQGIDELKKVALQSKQYFSEREQKVVNTIAAGDKVAVEIEYRATFAIDIPQGPKKGDKMVMRGVSIFECKQGKIYRLADYS